MKTNRDDNMKTAGLFSWVKCLEGTFFEETLKLSLLFFDDLVMQSPTSGIVTEDFPKILTKFDAPEAVVAEICKVIHPVQEYLPGYKFADPEVWVKDDHISDATQTALTCYFEERDAPRQEKGALAREVALTGCGVIDAINLVSQLSLHFNCFMIPTEFEHRVLAEITRPTDPRSSFDLFREVALYRLPKLKDVSWERILDLRHHRFLLSFRKTMSGLQAELRKTPAHSVKDLFLEIERKHIKELLSLLEPSVLQSTIKGIATNFPLPIPVNPLGVYDAIQSVRRDKMIAERFGWLYFLYELS